MELVPGFLQHKKIQHRYHDFATGAAATVLITAPATGLVLIPVWYRYTASAAGSVTLFAGSGGASVFQAYFVAGDERTGPWYGTDVGAATSIEIVKAAGVGRGTFDLWYIVHRLGAGSGGTNQ